MAKQGYLPTPEYSRNMRLIGHSSQGGKPDGVQVMVHRGYAYVGHMVSQGVSIIDVRDAKNPRPAGFIAAPANTWNVHLQAHDDLLLVINARDLFADASFAEEKVYYTRSVAQTVSTRQEGHSWSAGLRIFDISTPDRPREISFLPLDGIGIHRIWYVGGRWAYVSALLDGYSDYIFLTIDLANPQKPLVAGRYALPGMHTAAGEQASWPEGKRYALHHAIISGDTAYGSWRDGGLTLLDVSDRHEPKLISHRNWSPPFGGGTHTALPLPDRDLLVVLDEAVLDNQEDGEKHIWLFDIREPTNPVSISTFPVPDEQDYVKKGAHFGPHNLHENRPGSFVSSSLIFATYQNAGVRAYDISNPYQPKETGALVPAAPEKMMDKRPGRPQVIQSCDVFVDAQGIIYSTDYNGGLSIIEYLG
ncbi:LVIVD repeat-containing protein [Yersinia frederiksenii]|uniref:LVIVD repeat-containing protein n=1 Tax=Yersinia frederiksenii TaxID=29484 RepID=UPI0025AADCDC|nr:LVIVD repeat-containing protein [Yersinia frederiksenii]MDN0120816.1 LVIVD repeat-containing protein [Yersinia frederiksenii]